MAGNGHDFSIFYVSNMALLLEGSLEQWPDFYHLGRITHAQLWIIPRRCLPERYTKRGPTHFKRQLIGNFFMVSSHLFCFKNPEQSPKRPGDTMPLRFPHFCCFHSCQLTCLQRLQRPNTWRETFVCRRPWCPCPCRPLPAGLVGWGCGVGAFPKGASKG